MLWNKEKHFCKFRCHINVHNCFNFSCSFAYECNYRPKHSFSFLLACTIFLRTQDSLFTLCCPVPEHLRHSLFSSYIRHNSICLWPLWVNFFIIVIFSTIICRLAKIWKTFLNESFGQCFNIRFSVTHIRVIKAIFPWFLLDGEGLKKTRSFIHSFPTTHSLIHLWSLPYFPYGFYFILHFFLKQIHSIIEEADGLRWAGLDGRTANWLLVSGYRRIFAAGNCFQ